MPYLPTIVLAALGLLLLVFLLVRTARVLRAFKQTASMVATNTQDQAGLVRARSAALRVAFAQRRRKPENQ
ncbi:bacteriophage holin [Amycolatopsis sp., V23-08]|uniref:Bacteriophage holin n=1 Tax=Amycolatopsis heterodermiae TaxID=3110235 RepID=A0ABU5R511_9PSEU|nr:bacteriophage holin [Amycolatopsis sp., V23-08]MEA5361307.1 bacteriophage holin [Amycolatopsis sp., V23-08]